MWNAVLGAAWDRGGQAIKVSQPQPALEAHDAAQLEVLLAAAGIILKSETQVRSCHSLTLNPSMALCCLVTKSQ